MSATRKVALLPRPLTAMSLILSACGIPPQVVIETRIVDKQVTKVVEVPAPKWTGPEFGGVLNAGTAEGMPSIDALSSEHAMKGNPAKAKGDPS